MGVPAVIRTAIQTGEAAPDDLTAPEGCEGWQYLSIPWCGRAVLTQIMAVVGHTNFRTISLETLAENRRGQFWISPSALSRLREKASGSLS